METIHHVHAEDVAQLFSLVVEHRDNALGEKFYAVSGGSITLYGYAKLLYHHYGKEPQIGFMPWQEWSCHHLSSDAFKWNPPKQHKLC